MNENLMLSITKCCCKASFFIHLWGTIMQIRITNRWNPLALFITYKPSLPIHIYIGYKITYRASRVGWPTRKLGLHCYLLHDGVQATYISAKCISDSVIDHQWSATMVFNNFIPHYFITITFICYEICLLYHYQNVLIWLHFRPV